MTPDPIAAAVSPVVQNIQISSGLRQDPVSAVANFVQRIAENITPDAEFLQRAQSWYAIQKDANEEAEVSIYDAIGAWGITAKDFVSDLRKLDAKTIHLRLNTPGGEVFDGTAIHNALVEHPARVVVHVDGLAASAGSYIAMAGDEVRMADNTYMMIHNAWGGAVGDAEALQKEAALLEKMNNVIAGGYERKTGKSRDHWRALMDAETWFTADEAKAEGLADVVEPPTKKAASVQIPKPPKNLRFNKIPDPVKELWGLKNKAAAPPVVQAEPETQPENQTTKPPEASPSGDQAPATFTQEPKTMATETTPATPAVPANEIVTLNQQAIEGYIARGRTLGVGEGEANAIKRMQDIYTVCPDRPDLAINAFLGNQSAATVKLAYDAAVAAQNKAAEELRKMQTENARLQAVIATGGHPGVKVGLTAEASPAIPQGLDPEAQAQLEWDSDPMIRANNGGDKGKKTWLLFRKNQLSGGVRVLSRP